MLDQSISRRLFAGVGANLIDKVIVSGTQLLIVSIFSTRWGLHLYGLWILLATVPQFLAMGDFGFATAAGVKMTMARANGNLEAVTQTFHSACVAIAGSSVVMVAASIFISLYLPIEWLGSDPGLPAGELRGLIFLLSVYGISVIQGSIFFAGFRCDGKFALGAFWNAIIILIESTGAIAAVLFGGGPVMAAGALLAGRVTGLIGQNVLLRRAVPWLHVGCSRASRSEIASLVKPALSVMVLPLAQALSLQGSAVMLGIAAGQAAVPAFTAARTLSRIGLQACWLFNSALMPEASAAIARHDRKSLAMMVFGTISISAILVLPFAIGFGLAGKATVGIWTHGAILPSGTMMGVMAISILAGGFWFPLSNLILAANRPDSYTGIYVILAGLALPFSYLLCLKFGVVGVAAAMAALDTVMLGIIVFLVTRILVAPTEIIRAAPIAFTYASEFVRRQGTKDFR